MKKKQFIYLTLVIILLLSFSLNTTAQNLKIHFIDVGQGDSILIEAPAGKKLLVDGGDRNNKVTKNLINYLKKQKIKKLDYLISTHPHADHIGGLGAVIDNFKVEKVLDSGKVHSSKTYENYLIKIDQENIDFKTPRQGDLIELGKSKLKFLHPDSENSNYDLNNSSLVFVLEFGKQKFLFTGDIEKEVEKKLLKDYPELKTTLIKAAHHGSKSSSTKAWIKNLEPEVVVIQVGAKNKYGHPAAKVLNLYQNLNTQIYRNDLNGNIVLTSNGSNYTIKVAKSIKAKAQAKIKPKQKNSALININTASAQKLTELWGIGPATAAKIIAYRQQNGPFTEIEAIKKVKGIGTNKFEHWQNKITI